jgi:hypothetical protein
MKHLPGLALPVVDVTCRAQVELCLLEYAPWRGCLERRTFEHDLLGLNTRARDAVLSLLFPAYQSSSLETFKKCNRGFAKGISEPLTQRHHLPWG